MASEVPHGAEDSREVENHHPECGSCGMLGRLCIVGASSVWTAENWWHEMVAVIVSPCRAVSWAVSTPALEVASFPLPVHTDVFW